MDQRQLFFKLIAGPCSYLDARPLGISENPEAYLSFCTYARVQGVNPKCDVALEEAQARKCKTENRKKCPRGYRVC